jgi:hypothetical protein
MHGVQSDAAMHEIIQDGREVTSTMLNGDDEEEEMEEGGEE